MANELKGKKIAFLAANEGVEQVELTDPWKAVEDAGGGTRARGPRDGEGRRSTTSTRPTPSRSPRLTEKCRPAEYAGLVLPGGVANPDQLRTDPGGALVKAAVDAGKPVAAICHGPWTLIDAGVATAAGSRAGRASGPTSPTPAATWVDEEVVTTRPAPSSPAGNPTTSPPSAGDVEEFAEGRKDLFHGVTAVKR